MKEINVAKRLPQALFHLVIALAKHFADHTLSGLPMRVTHKHLRTIREHTFGNSPTASNSSFLKW